MPLKRSANGWSANVKSFLDEGSRFALPKTDSEDAEPKSDQRFALTDYNEEEYNSFWWVRANDVINVGYWDNFINKYRRNIYVFERRGIQQEASELLELHSKTDFRSYEKENYGGKVFGYNKQLGTERGTGSRATQKAAGGVQSPYFKVVHTFTDVTGRKRNVLKVSNNSSKACK